ncbi:glycosyltransferase family 4 protein [Brachybacterium sp. YJGR34]|uniref:glycosyltransferase family 4 protein n=1 Tax=Brachybacterium sp. YJGR34 TaxID=2059911 RepID=UPI000E0C3B3B|nr:glycosyltransferase family 4 protein [Brachybacterium sp. YJGR34]
MVLSPPAAPAVLPAAPLALWAVPVAELGGVARHVLDATAAGVPGWRVAVLCPPGPLAERLRERGVPVVVGPVSPADGAAVARSALRRTLRALRADLLHTHLAFADLTGVAAAAGLRSARGARLRVVSTEHGISGVRGLYRSGALEQRALAAAHRARLGRTDRVIAVSASTAGQVAAQWGSRERITVVRNGVDRPEPAPDPRAGLRILSLSRLAPEKRIDRVLRAFAEVAAAHPAAHLTLAGTGPEEPALRHLRAALELEDRVSLPGHLEPEQALRAHDVVVQLSAWENLSYTLLDAVAHGLGAVATDVGGTPEILPPRCLVDPEDLPAVAAAMVAQGTSLPARPLPAAQGESVASMCQGIARVYGEVMR